MIQDVSVLLQVPGRLQCLIPAREFPCPSSFLNAFNWKLFTHSLHKKEGKHSCRILMA